MIEIRRNEPCPCGSGKKYKKCCYMDRERNRKIIRAATRAQKREDIIKILNEKPRIYKLQVRLDSMIGEHFQSSILRTIEIEGTNSLYDLHLAIQKAFNWDNDHMFSFFMSDQIWDRENEYSANPLGEHMVSSFGEATKPAGEAEIGDLSLKQGKSFKYLFDYGDEIIHSIEVLDVYENEDADVSLPRIVKRVGKAPSQYDY